MPKLTPGDKLPEIVESLKIIESELTRIKQIIGEKPDAPGEHEPDLDPNWAWHTSKWEPY